VTDTMSGVPIGNVQRRTFNSQRSTGWPKGCMVGGIWGQTRSYGNTYRWAVHDVPVA